MRTFRIIFGLIVDLALFGMFVPWATFRTGHLLDGLFPVSLRPALLFDAAGCVFAAAGGAWLLWSWYLLVREGRGYMTELFRIEISPVTERLVASGPFSLHRHPVCAGYLFLLAGIGLAKGSFWSAAGCAPLLLILVSVYLRLFEEPGLRRRFGAEYDDYARRVPVFFPGRPGRVSVAYRNLIADSIRFAVTVAGVAFAVLLICFQLSVLKGTRSQITTYIDHAGADVWVMQKGVDDFVATSAVPKTSVDTVKRLDGVRQAAGIYAVYTLIEVNKVKSRVYVIGYDTATGDGGPWRLGEALPHVTGARALKDGEVLLDRDLARRHRLKVGDRVSLFGQTFTVAGFTLETNSIGSQYAFLSRDSVGRIMPGGGSFFTHVLVWTDGTVPGPEMVRRIAAATGLGCLTRDVLDDHMRDFLGMFMLPLLTAGVVMGFLVGSVTIGITLYTAVLERFKEYGTMKALGATDRFLYGILLRQALIALGLGTAVGLALAAGADRFINLWVPGMTAGLDGATVLQTVLAGLLMAVLSTGLPMWRLYRLDPMEAFRS